MKTSKAITRFLAIVMLVAMSAGLVGCVSSYNTNPIIAKVGSVDVDLNRFYSLYNNTDTNTNPYYAYMQYGAITREQYAKYILEDAVNYGLQLDQVKVQNITLDESEEAEVQQKADDNIKEYAVSTYGNDVDASITEEQAKADAAIELLKKELTDNGSNYEEYRKGIVEGLRNNALIEKLRKLNVGEITVTDDDMKKYFEDNSAAVTVASFKSAFDNFTSASSKAIPLSIPHPENAVEDDPETADVDEAKEANPYGSIFSVQHLLMKFETEATDEDANDLVAYAKKDEELTKKMEELEAQFPEMKAEDFLAKCFDKDVCEDPGMLRESVQFFGYMMQEELISSYYDGFGYAAMKLNFGEGWEPKTEGTETSTVEESKDYHVEFFTLADSTKIAKVFSKAGVHYIIINTNDIFNMYDADGYMMLPLYNGDELVTDSEGIVTANGHMTQAQLDAVNDTLSHVKAAASDSEENDEAAEDAEKAEEEEDTVLTMKEIFEYFKEAKRASIESEKYAEKFTEWKDKTKISIYEHILTPFYQQ